MKKLSLLRLLKGAAVSALAAAVFLSGAAPSYAQTVTDSGYSITITSQEQTELGGANRFWAYQIFSGTVSNTDGKTHLVGVQWGSGVDHEGLVTEMKTSPLPVGGGTFGSVFSAAYGDWTSNYASEMEEAEMVAQFLSQHLTDPQYSDAFARLVASHLKGGDVYYESVKVEGGWKVCVPSAGYYLIKDTYVSPEPDHEASAVSSYILDVLGQESVPIKASLPTVTKKVETQEGYIAGTDETVHYTLDGTVANNIAEYTKYYYKFVDQLPDGLTADLSSVEVHLDSTSWHKFNSGTDYTAKLEGKVLTIEFEDLLKCGVEITASSHILVSYTAQLNASAVAGAEGNENIVHLEYSNNPYSDDHGESGEDNARTYTFQLKVKKVGSGSGEHEDLEGVEFKLKREDGKFATFTENGGKYTLSGWVDGEEAGTALKTGSDGTFNIHGLDVGTYTLVETKALPDYETMKDVKFTISGSVDETSGDLKDTSLVFEKEHRDDITESGSLDDNSAMVTLFNFKAPELPATGGIGRVVVLSFGVLAVVAGVVVLLLAMRRKDGKKDA